MERTKYRKRVLTLIILAYFFFMLGNGIISLTIPDEVFYSQTAKEMIKYNSWMTPYLFGQPQFEKPPLTYWFLRIGFALFGMTHFGARFFPALFAIMGIVSVYVLGLLGFKDEKKAFLSAIVLMSCGLYVGLARTVFTDMIFSVLILLSLTSFYWGYSFEDKKTAGILLFFVFMGFAVLTKGPLGFLIPFLTAILFLFIKKDIKFLLCKYSFWGFLVFALISLPWYIFMIKRYGNTFIHEFFYNDHIRRIIEAEHLRNDTWFFYPLSMIGCTFPWSLFLLVSLIFLPRYLKQKENLFYVFLICQISVVFVIFQSAHSKLVSYIFPVFPALALITAGFIFDAASERKNNRALLSSVVGSLFTLFLIPIVLTVGLLRYSAYINFYVSSKTPIYYFILIFLILDIIMLFFILRNKLLKNIYCLALVVPMFLYHLPFIKSDIEPYFSTRMACEYLLNNHTVNNTILSSKLLVRGVRYYTDKEVAVIDMSGKPFFSPHPVSFLDSDVKIQDFLCKQNVTYCILKKSSLEDIERITAKDFKYTILRIIGNQYILKIESLSK